MYEIDFIVVLILTNVLLIYSKSTLNSSVSAATVTTVTTHDTVLSCDYCQKEICHCSSIKKTLNCSSYLLNLTLASNCQNSIIWEIVDFSSRNFKFINSDSLLSLRMYRLILKSNSITTIHNNAFDSVGDILIELDLQMNQLSNLSSTWLNSKLIQIKSLNLALNQLKTLVELDQVNLPNLQMLNLSWNQIENFPRQIQHWKSLNQVDLSFNRLSSIPRFALMGLQHLTWLSLASNRNLTCIVQDSFKDLQSLKYLDLSSTGLVDLDGCIFFQLTNLHSLKIEHVSINCSSCWLPIARENSIELFGECLNNRQSQRLELLTNEQLHDSCSKSSINCLSNYCEPTSFYINDITNANGANLPKYHTIKVVSGTVLTISALIMIVAIVILIYRWKQGQHFICCHLLSKTSSTMSEITRRHRQHQQKQIINKNPSVIESVVTHGANLNVPAHPQRNHACSNQTTLSNKRELYNPMFMESPKSDNKYHQSSITSDGSSSHSNEFYSENL